MQACLSSSSPVGQSMKPSHRTWSSMQWYLPILSAVGQANLSIPSSETGHSVNRIAKILLQSVGMKLTLCLNRKYSTGIMHVNVNVNIIRYLGGVGKIVHERYRGKMRERLGVIFPTWKRSGFPHKVYIILVVVFVTSSVFVAFFSPDDCERFRYFWFMRFRNKRSLPLFKATINRISRRNNRRIEFSVLQLVDNRCKFNRR